MFVIDSALWSLYQAIASLCHSWSLMLGQTRSNLASEGWARDHLVCFWYVWSNQGKCSSSTRLLDWFYHVLSKSSGKWSGRRRGTVVPLDLKQRSQFRYNIYIYCIYIYIYGTPCQRSTFLHVFVIPFRNEDMWLCTGELLTWYFADHLRLVALTCKGTTRKPCAIRNLHLHGLVVISSGFHSKS